MSVEMSEDYQIAVNPHGELLLVMGWQQESVDMPRLYYDGGEHALLMRTPESTVILPYLPEGLRVPLAFSTKVSVRETTPSGEVVHAYDARLHFAQDIPALRSIAETLRKDVA